MSTPSPAAAFAASLAQPQNQPEAGFAALHAFADALVGAKIFTVLAFDFGRQEVKRLHTSDPVLYPAGATDKLYDTIWERTLIGEKKPLVLNDHAALSTLLPEVDKLRAKGAGAMLNLPVVIGGEVLGALNMLHDSGRYTSERVGEAEALVPGAAALLLWKR
jgi:hypothetical protein